MVTDLTAPAPAPGAPHRMRANLLLLLTAIIWGFSFVAQVAGAEHVGPFTFNGVRFALGALSLLPLIAFFDARRRQAPAATATAPTGAAAPSLTETGGAAWRRALVPGLAAGAVLFTAAWLQQWGMGHTTAGNGGFITGLYMVLVPIFGIALGHRTSWNTWVGIVLAVVGLYLLSIKDGLSMSYGDTLVLIGTVFWATHILLIDRFSRLDPLRLSAVQFATCSVISLVAALASESEPLSGIGGAIIPLLYGGLMSVGVAYTLQVVAQRDAKASHAAMILSLESMFAAVGGALLLGENMGVRGYLGAALMMAGILLSQVGASNDPASVASDDMTSAAQPPTITVTPGPDPTPER